MVDSKKVRHATEVEALQPPEEATTEPSLLESPAYQKRYDRVVDWWYQERQAQSLNRYEMARDEDFYDGNQWTDEDRTELLERGQMASTFNLIKQSVDWLTGTEKRTRVDFKVFPRNADDVELAQVKTKLLKYIDDANKAGYARSRAFKDQVVVGLGWLEVGIRNDGENEPLYSRTEDWRNMWHDHLSREPNLSDSRYVFRSKWTDLDIAVEMFPKRARLLEQVAIIHNVFGDDDDEFYWLQNKITQDGRMVSRQSFFDDAFNVDNRRDRVRLIECWYRIPSRVRIIRGFPRLEGQIFDANDPFHRDVVNGGYASTVDALRMLTRCMMFTGGSVTGQGGVLLQDMASPYRHNRFPFIPLWCYRRGRDKMPYGMVRNLRDPQEDLNKRRSKALFILSTNRMVADDDAFEDWDEAADELARPDGILKKKKGSEVEIRNDTNLVEEHVMMAKEDAAYIQSVSGVHDDNLGKETNATSGVAIAARSDRGTIVTATIFDFFRLGFQLQGEIELSLIEQFYDQLKTFRISGGTGQMEFVTINQPQTDASGNLATMNDITASLADYIVDAQDFRESVRMAMFESLMNLCGQLPPEVTLQILDMVIELSDVPGKEEMVKRIRKLNGQIDPEKAGTPEAIAAEQAANARAEMQNATAQAQLEEIQAKVKKLIAEAQLMFEKAKSEQTDRSVSVAKVSIAHQEAKAAIADQGHRRLLETTQAQDAMATSRHRRLLESTEARANIQDQEHRHGMERHQAVEAMVDQTHRHQLERAKTAAEITGKEHDQAIKGLQATAALQDQEHRHGIEKTQTEATIEDQTERRKIEKYKAEHPPAKATAAGQKKAKKPGKKK